MKKFKKTSLLFLSLITAVPAHAGFAQSLKKNRFAFGCLTGAATIMSLGYTAALRTLNEALDEIKEKSSKKKRERIDLDKIPRLTLLPNKERLENKVLQYNNARALDCQSQNTKEARRKLRNEVDLIQKLLTTRITYAAAAAGLSFLVGAIGLYFTR